MREHSRSLLNPTLGRATGISDHVWEIEEIVALLDAKQKAMKRGPYKKRTG
jgi:hypothetical protein